MELLRKMKVCVYVDVLCLVESLVYVIPATSPALNWVKSRCSLEYQYGNLTLFRLAEVTEVYLCDPTIKTVSVMRNGRFHKVYNKNFRGIAMDVMDIYPVIKYCEIKFSERLGVIKEEKNNEKKQVPLSPTHTAQETLDKIASRENNENKTVTHNNHADDEGIKTNNHGPVLSSTGKSKDSDTKPNCTIVINNNIDVDKKHSNISAPLFPKKQLRKKHSYEMMDFESSLESDSIIRKDSESSSSQRKSSVYEVLDLASNLSSRKSSHAEEPTVVEALDLDSVHNFRTRSLITVSCRRSVENNLVSSTEIARQRSLQVENELTKSMDGATKSMHSDVIVKSKVPVPVHAKKKTSGSISSRDTSKSSGSFRSNLHLSIRSYSNRLSRKRYDTCVVLLSGSYEPPEVHYIREKYIC